MVLSSNQKNEMGGACSTFSCERKYIQGLWFEYLKESDHLFINIHLFVK